MEGLEMKGSSVFVSGATGLIGSHLVKNLVGLGADVVVLKRDHVKDSILELEGTINDVHVARGQLEDFDSVTRMISEYKIDTVLHLGAQAIVETSIEIPRHTFEANVRGTWNILEACRVVGHETDRIKRIVVASSDKAYGSSKLLPYTEDMPLGGESPYDVSKACTDMIAQSYYKTYKMPICVSRLGNVFGPGDLNFNRLIPGTIKSIIDGKDIVIRSDGQYTREFLYVKDAARAYVNLASKMSDKNVVGHAFNFGSGDRFKVVDVAEKIRNIMGSNNRIVIANTARAEIKEQFLSFEKASGMIGWKPMYGFDDGLKETIAWYTNFLGGRHGRNKKTNN